MPLTSEDARRRQLARFVGQVVGQNGLSNDLRVLGRKADSDVSEVAHPSIRYPTSQRPGAGYGAQSEPYPVRSEPTGCCRHAACTLLQFTPPTVARHGHRGGDATPALQRPDGRGLACCRLICAIAADMSTCAPSSSRVFQRRGHLLRDQGDRPQKKWPFARAIRFCWGGRHTSFGPGRSPRGGSTTPWCSVWPFGGRGRRAHPQACHGNPEARHLERAEAKGSLARLPYGT